MAEKIVKDSQGLAKELVNGVKEFEVLKVRDLNGRPYYSIIYLENGNEFEGYSSYNLKVISEYLKRHFGFAQPETHDKRTETHACDCVSGVAAIVAAIEAVDEWDGGYNVQRANMIRDAIKALPSAQPERKKGKWIEVDDAYNRIRGRCSACGWEAHMYEDDVVGMWFCPNCGADMRGEEDD